MPHSFTTDVEDSDHEMPENIIEPSIHTVFVTDMEDLEQGFVFNCASTIQVNCGSVFHR